MDGRDTSSQVISRPLLRALINLHRGRQREQDGPLASLRLLHDVVVGRA
jgi:hypothetical protein